MDLSPSSSEDQAARVIQRVYRKYKSKKDSTRWWTIWQVLDKDEERVLLKKTKDRDLESIREEFVPLEVLNTRSRTGAHAKLFRSLDFAGDLGIENSEAANRRKIIQRASLPELRRRYLSGELFMRDQPQNSAPNSELDQEIQNVSEKKDETKDDLLDLLEVEGRQNRFSTLFQSSLEGAILRMIHDAQVNENTKDGGKLVDDPSYTGPHLIYPLTVENIVLMIEHFRKMGDFFERDSDKGILDTRTHKAMHFVPLHRIYLVDLLKRVELFLIEEPNVVSMGFVDLDERCSFSSDEDEEPPRIHVVGDLHGQLSDLLLIIENLGYPREDNIFIFNGDFVDRGHFSIEVVIILFALKVCFPRYVFLNRGNHEARNINLRDGFEKECLLKYDSEIFDCFSEVFACLPLATIIERKVFVVHGGLSWDLFTIDELQRIDRFVENPESGSLLEDILWSDPQISNGKAYNDRGAGCTFGPDVCAEFLGTNQLEMVVRSHQCVKRGYQRLFSGRLFTVFSASNYCGKVDNRGAVLSFTPEGIVDPDVFQYSSTKKELMSRFSVVAPHVPVVIQDVLCRITDRVLENQMELAEFWSRSIKQRGGFGTWVTLEEWSSGLTQVLRLKIPWIEIIEMMHSCGEFLVDAGSMVDYAAFLRVNDPMRAVIEDQLTNGSHAQGVQDFIMRLDKEMSSIMDMIYLNRGDLQTAFRWLDVNGSGKITTEEFHVGLKSLQIVPRDDPHMDQLVDRVIQAIDSNGDGMIEYYEFFQMFESSVYRVSISQVESAGISS